MRFLEPNKTFMIQIHVPGLDRPIDEIALGRDVERAVLDAQNTYPDYKRIVIYDADTKDAIKIIKK